jgi:ketosteroid isomerase-like protein
MKIVRRIFALLALLALGLWLWSVLFPGPEKIIRKQLAAVAEVASFAGNEGPLSKASNAAKLAGYVSVNTQVTFDAPGHGQQILSGRDEIQQFALGVRSTLGSLAVEFLDVNVTLAADKQSATVDLTARVKVGGESSSYVQEMKFVLKKMDGQWLIVRVETVKTLSRVRMGEVGRVTPCAPPSSTCTKNGAHGVRRPTFLALVTCHLSPV